MINNYTTDTQQSSTIDTTNNSTPRGNGEDKQGRAPSVVQLDFMAVRKRLMPLCGDPVGAYAEIQKIHRETGMPLGVLRASYKECIRERAGRDKADRKNELEKKPKRISHTNEDPFIYGTNGEIKDCPYNIGIFLSRPEWKGRLRLNKLRDEVELDGVPIRDIDISNIVMWLGKHGMAVRSPQHIKMMLTDAAGRDAYHPIIEYLESLVWDGVPRIADFLPDVLNTERSPYTAWVGKIIICGMIERARNPSCVMRYVPILEGQELKGKSAFVRDLGYPWSGELSATLDGKQALEDINGMWLMELTEMETLRRSSANRMKAFVSTRNDRYRKSYGYFSEDHPRTTVFIGTVNPGDAQSLFQSEEENTRYWPVLVNEYDADALSSMKDQLFAEGKAILEAEHGTWWTIPEDINAIAKDLREERSTIDPWESIISSRVADFIARGKTEITMDEVFSDFLEIPVERQSKKESTRIGLIMHRLGWVRSRVWNHTRTMRHSVYRKCDHAT